jgi:hypothetical protein
MSYLVTENDLARARRDPEFRQKLMVENLERLLEVLNEMRKSSDIKPDAARQIREGVDLAVKLANRLQQNAHNGPHAA